MFFDDGPAGANISLFGHEHGRYRDGKHGTPTRRRSSQMKGLMKTIRLAQVSALSVAWASIAIQDDVRGSANESLIKTIRVTQVRVVRRPGVDGSDCIKCDVTTFANSLCSNVRCACQLLFAQFGMFLMPAARQILDFSLCERWLLTSLVVVCLVTPSGGGETGSPPPMSGGFISDGRGYFGGRGTAHRPLPHILEVAFLLVSGDFGGGRIGTSPFLLTLPVCTS